MNKLLAELAVRCAREDGVRDYFHVSIVGYADDVRPALGGALSGRHRVPISDIANTPLRVEDRSRKVPDGVGGLVEQTVKFPVWFEPVADGLTAMTGAFGEAQRLTRSWVAEHPDGYPPTVINITDGQANDGDPEPVAADLRSVSSSDGPVLLFNLHVSAAGGAPLRYPATPPVTSDPFSAQLFSMSSALPPAYADFAATTGVAVHPGARGMVYQAGMEDVVGFLEIGTRAGA